MRTFARSRPLRRAVCCLLLPALVALSSCRMHPKGTTVVKFLGKERHTGAQLFPPESEERRAPIRLKYYDTNTFSTAEPLAPGRYVLAVRIGEGGYRSREMVVEPGKDYYEISETAPSAASRQGPQVRGEIGGVIGAKMPSEVVVLFIGHDVIVRRVAVDAKRFSTHAPAEGSYRIEVFALGDPPRSWTKESVRVGQALDLGSITLK